MPIQNILQIHPIQLIIYNSMNTHLHHLIRTALVLTLLITAASANAQNITFDVRDAKTGDNYKATVNTSSRRINVNRGSQSVFSATYVQAKALNGGVAFSFRQGQTPSLTPDTDSIIPTPFFSVGGIPSTPRHTTPPTTPS